MCVIEAAFVTKIKGVPLPFWRLVVALVAIFYVDLFYISVDLFYISSLLLCPCFLTVP